MHLKTSILFRARTPVEKRRGADQGSSTQSAKGTEQRHGFSLRTSDRGSTKFRGFKPVCWGGKHQNEVGSELSEKTSQPEKFTKIEAIRITRWKRIIIFQTSTLGFKMSMFKCVNVDMKYFQWFVVWRILSGSVVSKERKKTIDIESGKISINMCIYAWMCCTKLAIKKKRRNTGALKRYIKQDTVFLHASDKRICTYVIYIYIRIFFLFQVPKIFPSIPDISPSKRLSVGYPVPEGFSGTRRFFCFTVHLNQPSSKSWSLNKNGAEISGGWMFRNAPTFWVH